MAIYTGNARAWQDDNFVRGDKLTIYVNEKKMDADGRVQSQIYNARRKTEGALSTVPVFATGDSMTYSDPNRILHYEGNVDIRQGTDRITSGVADVYLLKQTSEVEKTIAQRNVVLTQPNRKGTGDWVAVYERRRSCSAERQSSQSRRRGEGKHGREPFDRVYARR